MVAVVVQSVFRLEIYQDDFFILKKLFFISTHQNEPKILILNKNNIFLKNTGCTTFPIMLLKKNRIFYLVFVNS